MTAEKTRTYEGLRDGEVERSRREHGANVFSQAQGRGFWRCFLGNLGDPVIKVLLIALALHLVLMLHHSDWIETAGIAASVLLATLISTLSEYGSEAAFARLREDCSVALCRVRRGGRVMEIPTSDVVVGDVVLLGAGERVPADGRLLCGSLTVDQSALTGESREVEKKPCAGTLAPDAVGAVLAGCTVQSGEGEIEVLAVGDATLLGHISGELQAATRESPLKLRLSHLARQISILGYVAALLCVLAYLFNELFLQNSFCGAAIVAELSNPARLLPTLLHALTLGLTVVVVAVPEGLPMMIAVVLSSNMKRMVRDSVLVRKPAGLEAAGSMNILFTDKTGTLTVGKPTLYSILWQGGEAMGVRALQREAPAIFESLLLAAHANTGATVGEVGGHPEALGGNGTDRALLSAFLAFTPPTYRVSWRMPFDSTAKLAVTCLTDGRVLVMGAPERLMPHVRAARQGNKGGEVPLHAAAFSKEVREHMARGQRVLLVCEGEGMQRGGALPPLSLVCAVTLSDPPRPECRGAVAALQGAGVQVVMMTGDGRETALHVAAASGIWREGSICLEGAELSRMQDSEIADILPRLAVICRALPQDKSRLVRICEAKGLVVGMTGDGINDAPALKLADVGFSMGSGTQVAKDAGDVVIMDDNLSSVVRAVLYGRTIFKSIRKFITLQLVMNFCAVGISVLGPFIGFEAPVTVVQMLWVNIIMDTLGGLAFAGEAPLGLYLKEKPIRRDTPILSRAIVGRIAFLTLTTLAVCVLFLTSPHVTACFRESRDDVCLLTAFFAFFIFAAVVNCFHARSDRVRMLMGLFSNRAFLLIMSLVAAVQIAFVYLGGAVLRTVPLLPRELGTALLLSLLLLLPGWLHLVARRLGGKGQLY